MRRPSESSHVADLRSQRMPGGQWLITNVRLRVDSVDGDETVIASASGWVIGDVKAGPPRCDAPPC